MGSITEYFHAIKKKKEDIKKRIEILVDQEIGKKEIKALIYKEFCIARYDKSYTRFIAANIVWAMKRRRKNQLQLFIFTLN